MEIWFDPHRLTRFHSLQMSSKVYISIPFFILPGFQLWVIVLISRLKDAKITFLILAQLNMLECRNAFSAFGDLHH